MYPLSDLLSLCKPRSYVSGGFNLRSHTAIQWPKHDGIKCYAVASGQCWLSVEGVPEAVLLRTGDCYLLPPGAPFRLATDLSVTPIDYETLTLTQRLDVKTLHGDGDGCYLVGGHFVLTGSCADMLLKALPPIVHIREESDKAAMRSSLERLNEEVREPKPARSLIAQQLAFMMLAQALRLHFADGARTGVGWLFALADKHLNAANHFHARRSRVSVDTAELGGAYRYVAIDLCPSIQRESRDDSYGLPHMLADDAGQRAVD